MAERPSINDVRSAAMALSAKERSMLGAELLASAGGGDSRGRLTSDARVLFCMDDAEKPTWVQLCRSVPSELMPSVLGQLRRVSPGFKPIAWMKARLLETHDELEAIWRAAHSPLSTEERATLFKVWRITKATLVALARGDSKGLGDLNNSAKKALKASRDGELTEEEGNCEKRPGACLFDREYGGQGAVFYGDVEELGAWHGRHPIGLADDSILTAETIEQETATIVNAAELGDGKSAMAESAVRWLRLVYPLSLANKNFDLLRSLCGRGWMLDNKEDWAPKDSILWQWIVRINDAALATGSAPLFSSSKKPVVHDEFHPEFDATRIKLREAVEQWFSNIRARDVEPTGDDFEALIKLCCYALGCESKAVDNLFAAKSKRTKGTAASAAKESVGS